MYHFVECLLIYLYSIFMSIYQSDLWTTLPRNERQCPTRRWWSLTSDNALSLSLPSLCPNTHLRNKTQTSIAKPNVSRIPSLRQCSWVHDERRSRTWIDVSLYLSYVIRAEELMLYQQVHRLNEIVDELYTLPSMPGESGKGVVQHGNNAVVQ